jgi:hypothetical protein
LFLNGAQSFTKLSKPSPKACETQGQQDFFGVSKKGFFLKLRLQTTSPNNLRAWPTRCLNLTCRNSKKKPFFETPKKSCCLKMLRFEALGKERLRALVATGVMPMALP